MKKAMFTKQFTASFTAETYDRIKELTDQKGISMAEWLRLAAVEKLATSSTRETYQKEEENHE